MAVGRASIPAGCSLGSKLWMRLWDFRSQILMTPSADRLTTCSRHADSALAVGTDNWARDVQIRKPKLAPLATPSLTGESPSRCEAPNEYLLIGSGESRSVFNMSWDETTG